MINVFTALSLITMTALSPVSLSPSRLILLIDDEPDVRRVVQTCLEKLTRWTVIAVASGEEGLLKATTEKPDAIVLDMMMPGMDGYKFLDALLAKPETQSIPVVFLTAKAESHELRQYEALGVKGTIPKPFNPLTLHRDIAAALGWNLDTR
jgi:CheY-like chemotaxis protein